MSFVDEIVESFRTHPEKWKWSAVPHTYGYWYCTSCTDLSRFERDFKLGKRTKEKHCSNCGTYSSEHVHIVPKHSILKHDSGITLRNSHPQDDKHWVIVEPELTYVGWWGKRKLRKAIPALRKAQIKLKLFDIEI